MVGHSHTAIIAKSLGIGCCWNCRCNEHMDTEEMIILDGDRHIIYMHQRKKLKSKDDGEVRRECIN
ncbi:MAG: PEP-utilizing enzyme [[Clostridium] scindens]